MSTGCRQIFAGLSAFQQVIRGGRCLHTSPLAAKEVLVEGISLNYEVAGEGDKVALCLPGALGTIQSDFGPQMKALPERNLTLVCWDPPGYGKSRPPSRKYPLDFLRCDATLAATMMKNLGYDKYSLLGWSDGGISAMMIAAANARHVDKMVIWGANAYVTEQDVKIYEGLRDLDKWSEKMRAPLEATYGKEYFKTAWEGWVDGYADMYYKNDGDICKGDLAKIVCPTLIIHGAKDPLISMEHCYYLKENIKGSQLIIMENGKHNLHLRYQDEFNNMVSDFLGTQ
ncbi:valacyclovir hydrolase [Panulirus ornatus]|uniref:valacyclovir hydrolase n=1 Tax=Panulirus ornatus TaxID=150431 RepID=UPI003A863AAC